MEHEEEKAYTSAYRIDVKRPARHNQGMETDPAIFRTIRNSETTLKSPILLNDQFPQPHTNLPGKRMKSLPQIRPSAKTLYVKDQKEKIGTLYKGIFTPHVGRILGALTKKRHEIAPKNQGAFITEKSVEEPSSLNNTSRRCTSIKRSQNNEFFLKQKLNRSKIATERLFDDIMSNGSHSLRTQLTKFAETGDKAHLLYCDSCPHCRLRTGDFYSVKKKLERARDTDEFFFDFFDLGQRIKDSSVCCWRTIIRIGI